jgi:hypothetical protein
VNEIISEYGQVKQTIKEWEQCQQRTDEKFRHLEYERRKNNIIIFGVQEEADESYLAAIEVTMKFLSDTLRVDISKENIAYVTRLGTRRGERPILVRFTLFFKKLEVWRNKKNLAGTKFRVDEDLSTEERKARRELLQYLKDAKKWGHKAFLREQALILNGRSYGLNYLKENIHLVDVDNPGNMHHTARQQG